MRPSSGGGGGGAAASPQVQETYGDDLSTVNYVDMDFELQHSAHGDSSGTDNIKPFVKLVNDVSCSPLASAGQSSCAHARRLCACRSARRSRRSTDFSRPGAPQPLFAPAPT